MRYAATVLALCALFGCGGSKIRTAALRVGESPLEEIAGITPCTATGTAPGHLNPDAPLTLLVHGCNDSAGRFDKLSDVFDAHGQQAICFTYESRDTIDVAARSLRRALARLEQRLPGQPITVLGHSQGGLVARRGLTAMPEEPELQTDYRLVTIASPFAGIHAARHCAARWLYGVSLGITPMICRGVAGKNWVEIHRGARLVREPGTLSPIVSSYLQIRTDERTTCRHRDAAGRCVKDDFVFSLAEQTNPKAGGPGFRAREIGAGHVQIVGHDGQSPTQLIGLLQDEGIMRPTPRDKQVAMARLIASLYGVDVPDR